MRGYYRSLAGANDLRHARCKVHPGAVTEMLAALLGALVGGAVVIWQTHRLLNAEEHARLAVLEREETARIDTAAQTALSAVAEIVANCDQLPTAWQELGQVKIVGEQETTAFTPHAWVEQRQQAEHAITALRRVALVESAVLARVGLGDRLYQLALLVEEAGSKPGAAAMSDLRKYAEYVHRSLYGYLLDGTKTEHADAPALDGTWEPPRP